MTDIIFLVMISMQKMMVIRLGIIVSIRCVTFGYLMKKESVLINCQTADYLRRFPQIISDGNTCHILRLMMRMHIISGQTADYRGLISVQLWLD